MTGQALSETEEDFDGRELRTGVALLTPADVAAQLAVSRTWVYEAAKTGRIPSIRLGGEEGTLRFVGEDIERWLKDARSSSRPGQTPTRRDLRREALRRGASPS